MRRIRKAAIIAATTLTAAGAAVALPVALAHSASAEVVVNANTSD